MHIKFQDKYCHLNQGEQRILLGDLAIKDGIPSIKTVENKGAVPPGI